MLYIFQVGSAFIVCAATNPYVLILYLPVGYAFTSAARIYQLSARKLKRLDSISRSPFLNLVLETISGIETVRSSKMVELFSARCEELVNNNAKFDLMFESTTRWFCMRTDWLVSVIIAAVAILAIATKSSIGAAAAGLGLTYAAQLTSFFQRLTALVTQVDNIMTCFERITHYDDLDEEGCQRISTYKDALDSAWPKTASGEKVGICGRTECGKSLLMSVLFRVVEIPTSGDVLIDGVNIATITVRQLRTKLTIILQDPILLLAMNLDPFGENTDAELYAVLRRVHLLGTISSWGNGLDYHVAEKGGNLSVGQRQLLCIARALIRDSKVVVMDEATANVDFESERLI
ncbi:unnamed protein product [Peronospora belbahrii]|uniref:ABC transmembrane type-1 domain-containing protein n=1 Tax=Peronospora belbahrii TaxID=622444 RepID=A0AAU9KM13_9STRA|nr:unnamed protein product [Peronospora belbahrii]